MGVAVFEFKAAAGDAEVVPECPGERDDEAYEHPEDCKCRFFDERRYDHGEAKPELKLRIDKRKEVVHEVQVQCRKELVLRNECRELVRVLNLVDRCKDEHAANAYAAKRFKSADREILLNLDRGDDQGACDDDCANSNVDVVTVSLRPNVQEPILVGECEECFREADFSNANGHKECRDEEKNACNNGVFHGCSLKNVCRFFKNFLRAYPIDGFGVVNADVVDDGKCNAECGNAEQDNPI